MDHDYASLSVKELRSKIKQLGLDSSHCIEKSDLVELLRSANTRDSCNENKKSNCQQNKTKSINVSHKIVEGIVLPPHNDSEITICALCSCEINVASSFFHHCYAPCCNIYWCRTHNEDNMCCSSGCTELSVEQLVALCQEGARKGWIGCYLTLAMLYDKGCYQNWHIEKNAQKSFNLFEAAAEQGNCFAQYKIATELLQTLSPKADDEEKGMKFAHLAANQGIVQCHFLIGLRSIMAKGPQKDLTQATESFERVLQNDGNNNLLSLKEVDPFVRTQSKLYLAKIYLGFFRTDENSNPDYFDYSGLSADDEIAERHMNPSRARQLLEELLESDKNNASALYLMYVFYSHVRFSDEPDLEKARKFLNKAAKLGNENAQKTLELFRFKCMACKKSETDDKKHLLCSRCHSAYYCSRACQKSDWKKSHKKHCKPLKNAQTQQLQQNLAVKKKVQQGEKLFEGGNFKAAEKAYLAAMDLTDQSASLCLPWYKLGTLYIHVEKYEKALPLFKKITSIVREEEVNAVMLGHSYRFLGIALHYTGKAKEAEEALRKAIAFGNKEAPEDILEIKLGLNPCNTRAQDEAENMIKVIPSMIGAGVPDSVRQANFRKAEKICLKSLDVHELFESHEILSMIYKERGDLSREIQHLERGIELLEKIKQLPRNSNAAKQFLMSKKLLDLRLLVAMEYSNNGEREKSLSLFTKLAEQGCKEASNYAEGLRKLPPGIPVTFQDTDSY